MGVRVIGRAVEVCYHDSRKSECVHLEARILERIDQTFSSMAKCYHVRFWSLTEITDVEGR